MLVKVTYLGFYPLGSGVEVGGIPIMRQDWRVYRGHVIPYGKKHTASPLGKRLYYVSQNGKTVFFVAVEWGLGQYYIFTVGEKQTQKLSKKVAKQKILVQKSLFLFMNATSVFFAGLGLYGGFALDSSWFSCLCISLFLSLLSCLFLINRIYLNETTIRFSLVHTKATLPYDEAKEILLQTQPLAGMLVIINFEKEMAEGYTSTMAYFKQCKQEGIKTPPTLVGITRKDLELLLYRFSCPIKMI